MRKPFPILALALIAVPLFASSSVFAKGVPNCSKTATLMYGACRADINDDFKEAKAICLNFGIAAEHKDATCNLRFDDTNPSKEEVEYVEAIKDDVRWLGFDWQDREYYASDYFEQLYGFAVQLIKDGKAYVDKEIYTAAEAIELITAAGGVAVLAHPVSLRMGRVQLYEYLKSQGKA